MGILVSARSEDAFAKSNGSFASASHRRQVQKRQPGPKVGHRAGRAVLAGDLRQFGISPVQRKTGASTTTRTSTSTRPSPPSDVGDRPGQGVVQSRRGLFHFRQERIDQACADCQKALEIHRELGNRRYETMELGNIEGHLQEGHHADRARRTSRPWWTLENHRTGCRSSSG